jgi:hypothetical protein
VFAVQGKHSDVASQYFFCNIEEASEDSPIVFFFKPKDPAKADDAAAVSSP